MTKTERIKQLLAELTKEAVGELKEGHALIVVTKSGTDVGAVVVGTASDVGIALSRVNPVYLKLGIAYRECRGQSPVDDNYAGSPKNETEAMYR